MGIHTGAAELRDGDYYGTAVNRAARLMSVAHGGQILVSLATSELLRDTPTELVHLGEHHLRDLDHPEHIFQVMHEGLPREFPPLRSVETLSGNLRAQVTSFVGRSKELREIEQELQSSRIVTLTGVGGVGKTRLARSGRRSQITTPAAHGSASWRPCGDAEQSPGWRGLGAGRTR